MFIPGKILMTIALAISSALPILADTLDEYRISSLLLDGDIVVSMTMMIADDGQLDLIRVNLENVSTTNYRLGVPASTESLTWGLFLTDMSATPLKQLINKDNQIVDFELGYEVRVVEPQQTLTWTIDVEDWVGGGMTSSGKLLAENLRVSGRLRLFLFSPGDDEQLSFMDAERISMGRIRWEGRRVRQ